MPFRQPHHYRLFALAGNLVWLAASTGCVPNDEVDPATTGQAIVSGQLETGYPEVGLIEFEVAGRAQPYDIEKREPPGTMMICSGTLIGPRQILTAAHCVDDLKRGRFKLDSGPAEGMPLHAPIIHPGYAGVDKGAADIAIVFLAAPVEDLAFPELAGQAPRVGETLTVVGWGKASKNDPVDRRKRSATNKVELLMPHHFNLTGFRGGEGITCSGDSGGPSYITRDGRPQLAGVHSTSTCDEKLLWLLDVSGASDTRVDVYTDWISQVAWNPPPPPLPLLRLHTPLHTQMPASFELQLSATGRVPIQEISVALDGGPPQTSPGGAVRQRIGPLTLGAHVVVVSARDQDGFVARQQWRFTVTGAGAGPLPAFGNPAPLTSTPTPAPITDPRGSAACPDPAAPTCGLPPWEATADEGGCAIGRRAARGPSGDRSGAPPPPPPALIAFVALLLALSRTRRRTGRER